MIGSKLKADREALWSRSVELNLPKGQVEVKRERPAPPPPPRQPPSWAAEWRERVEVSKRAVAETRLEATLAHTRAVV